MMLFEMIIRAHQIQNVSYGDKIGLRCPGCGNYGTFETVGASDLHTGNRIVGIRRCPYELCNALVYYWVLAGRPDTLRSFPPQRIDFDATDVPDLIKSALEDSITCHSVDCYAAAAMMIRKTMELLCDDKGAKGKDLETRIEALGRHIVIAPELLSGMHKLRFLGNDAAHIECRVFNDVGEEEVETGIAFAKVILQAVYQNQALLQRLSSLQTDPEAESPTPEATS